MNITEAIKIAFLSLWANKLRSALTLLGVVIGVAAVIAVVTFVNGINGYVATKIFNLGADVFIVFKNSPAVTNIDKYLEGEKRKDLTMEDYEAVLEACKHCEWVGAALRNDSGHVKYGEQSISDTIVRGMTPSMVPILDIDLTAGRMINDVDLRNNSAVVVVGPDIVDNLIPGMDPINKELRIDGWVYRVIGVGKRKGKTLGQSMDNYALMPITAFQKQNGSPTRCRHPLYRSRMSPTAPSASRARRLPAAPDSKKRWMKRAPFCAPAATSTLAMDNKFIITAHSSRRR